MAPSAIPSFVINLPRSAERRRHMERQLESHGLDSVFCEAVDGRGLSAAERVAALSPTEQGCLLSHMSVWRRVASERPAAALVLEDDCELLTPFQAVLASPWLRREGAAIVQLGHHSARHPPAHGAEVCFFGRALAPGVRLARLAEFPMGAYAYVVTPEAAERLLRFAVPFRMPADWVTGYAPSAGVAAYGVSPPCVVPQRGIAEHSTIKEADVAPGAPAPPEPARPGLRAAAGTLWLWARKLGVRPHAYSKAL